MGIKLQKLANPQGKGITGVVEDLRACTPLQVQAKSSHQWLADYFTSTLVLSAKFGFNPVIAKSYYLYIKGKEWKLSLIEPQTWTSHNLGIYFAKCLLHKDMSWSLEPRQDWQKNKLLLHAVHELERQFLDSINNELPIIDHLPFFVNHLTYYQILGANALARSLKKSLALKLGKKESYQIVGSSMIAELAKSNIPLIEFSS